MVKPNYQIWTEFRSKDRCHEDALRFIAENPDLSVLEIGAGANPTISVNDLSQYPNLKYTTNDIDLAELSKADPRYQTLHKDFCDPKYGLTQSYDLIFSRMVNEHVRSGETYYRNIFDALKPGGITFHFFSTLYAFPFLVNRLVPEYVSSKLLSTFHPRDEFQHGKFKAFYSWGRGPTKGMIDRFEQIGFEVLQYNGYFGHVYYKNRLRPLHHLEVLKSKALVKFPTPFLTSYAHVVLRRGDR